MSKKEFIINLPDKKNNTSLKTKSVFVFDSCSLLSLYSFTDKERSNFLFNLKKLADENRIWLPYQFLEEFEMHRLEKIQEQHEAYTKFKNIVDIQFKNIIQDQSMKDFGNHKFLKKYKENYIKRVKNVNKEIVEELNKAKSEHPDWRFTDPVKKVLMKCFDGKIGDPYSDERYEEIFSIGLERYSKFIPPGYKDANKNRTDITKKKQYGDLIAWFQIMDYAKNHKKPIVIVTDDMKEDWWNKQSGRSFGPRVELMYEIYDYAGTYLEMFSMEKFLNFARKELEFTVRDTLLEKVKRVESKENFSNTPIASDESGLGTGNIIDLGTPNEHE
jgi:hypothetical protein